MKKMAIVVVLLGMVAVVLGGVFIGMGVAKNNQLVGAMQVEQVALPLGEDDVEPSAIDSAGEAQAAGDLIREHRRGIAPSYQELLGDERFDPTNPDHLTYAQALNMENYLYLAVIGFGLIQATLASGVFMVITGLALGSTGVMLYRFNQKLS